MESIEHWRNTMPQLLVQHVENDHSPRRGVAADELAGNTPFSHPDSRAGEAV